MSTHNISLSIKKENHTNTKMSAAVRYFCVGLENEFEIAVVNEPLLFEPVKFNCNSYIVNQIK